MINAIVVTLAVELDVQAWDAEKIQKTRVIAARTKGFQGKIRMLPQFAPFGGVGRSGNLEGSATFPNAHLHFRVGDVMGYGVD
jgi:hypothetical protein